MPRNKTGAAHGQKAAFDDITVEDLGLARNNKKANAKFLQIVKTAADLFHTKGYGPTTVRDIGTACNISAGHLYYYIKSKDDFPAIFKEIHENDIYGWEKSIRKDIGRLSPEELVEKAVRDYARLTHIRRKMAVFWYHAAMQVNREHGARVREVEVRIVSLFEEIIELGNKEGQFHVSDPFILACNIHMMCQTWALKRWLIRDSRSIGQYSDTIVDMIMEILGGVHDDNPGKDSGRT